MNEIQRKYNKTTQTAWRRLRIPPHVAHTQYPQENQWNKDFIYLRFQMGNPKNKEKRKQNNDIEIRFLLFWSLPLRYQNDFHLWRNLHLRMQEETIWEEWRTWERNKDAENAREKLREVPSELFLVYIHWLVLPVTGFH